MCKSKFYRVGPVPCALKSKREDELSRLFKLRINPFVSCDKYLVPKAENILAIKNGGKLDEPILIRGDSKQTLNKVASCYKYPVPKTEGILPAINGVKQLQC